MNAYDQSLQTLHDLFAKDCQFALATASGSVPSVRIVDTFYDDGAFYVVAHASTQKVREIAANEHVSLCHNLYRFSGKAQNIGHPLQPQNSGIRAKLSKAFALWYFKHNNEQDEKMCYIRINLTSGFFYRDGKGYAVDFTQKSADIFPFEFGNTVIN